MSAIVQHVVNASEYSSVTNDLINLTLLGVSPASAIIVWFTCDNSNSPVASCSDGTAYTALPAILDSTNNQMSQCFYLQNASSGTHPITVSLNALASFRAVEAIEVSGVAASAFDVATGQFENAPGTGADALNSGSVSATAAGIAIGWGFATAQAGIPATGTGWSSYSTDGVIFTRIEYKTIGAGSVDATFTAAANTQHIAQIIVLKDGGGGGAALSGAAAASASGVGALSGAAAALSGSSAAVALATGSLSNLQTASPSSDIAAGAWLPSAGSSLHPMLSEAVPDHGTFIWVPTANSVCELLLTSLSDPGVSAGHVVPLWASSPVSATLRFRIMQGATQIAQWDHALTPTLTLYSHTLSGAEADAITDYTDLRVRIEAL